MCNYKGRDYEVNSIYSAQEAHGLCPFPLEGSVRVPAVAL